MFLISLAMRPAAAVYHWCHAGSPATASPHSYAPDADTGGASPPSFSARSTSSRASPATEPSDSATPNGSTSACSSAGGPPSNSSPTASPPPSDSSEHAHTKTSLSAPRSVTKGAPHSQKVELRRRTPPQNDVASSAMSECADSSVTGASRLAPAVPRGFQTVSTT